jgi:hypothetical protein
MVGCLHQFHYAQDDQLEFCNITKDVCPGNCSYFDDTLEDVGEIEKPARLVTKPYQPQVGRKLKQPKYYRVI